MGESLQSLEGNFEHKLDSKYRVSVPAAWRPAAGETVSLRLLQWKHLKVPVLRIMTNEAFDAAIASIDNQEGVTPGVRNAQKQAVRSGSISVQLNDQGKLAIPKKKADDYGIKAGGTAHLFGRGHSFDLVAPKHVDEMREKEAEVMEALYDNLDFG